MPSIDQTSSFQSIFQERLSFIPPSSRSKSPSRDNSSRKGKGKGKATDSSEEDFLKEAYRIHNHLTSLENLITSVRKPYLSTVEPPPLSRRIHRDNNRSNTNGEQDAEVDQEEWRKWEKVKYLTDRERDEIDLRARMILRRCKDRVGVLELGEQAKKSPKSSSSISSTKSTVLSFLPSLLPSDPTSSTSFKPLIKAHRASIIWTLNDYLTKLTSVISNLQEERFKRKEERLKSLGSNATFEATKLERSKERKIPDGLVVNVDDPAFSKSNDSHLSGISITDSSNPPIEQELSSSQIQQFENENNILLENMSSTLSSVLSAETSLIEISNLQNELIINLNIQNEKIDLLYEDAIDSINQIDNANDQLKKAKKAGQESRIFLLIFLVGASLALLFLDWYAA